MDARHRIAALVLCSLGCSQPSSVPEPSGFLVLAINAKFRMNAISVSPPKFAPPPAPPEPLNFEVFILADGFRISTAKQPAQGTGPNIPLAKPGAPMDDYDRWDYAALEATAKQLEAEAPHETTVTLRSKNDIPMQVLIATMDALRGSECDLTGVEDGDPIPEACLFYQPIVSGNAD